MYVLSVYLVNYMDLKIFGFLWDCGLLATAWPNPCSFLDKILKMAIGFFTGLGLRSWLSVTHLAFLPKTGKWIQIDIIIYSGPLHLEILLLYYEILINYNYVKVLINVLFYICSALSYKLMANKITVTATIWVLYSVSMISTSFMSSTTSVSTCSPDYYSSNIQGFFCNTF